MKTLFYSSLNSNKFLIIKQVQINSQGEVVQDTSYVYVPDDNELMTEVGGSMSVLPLYDTLQVS